MELRINRVRINHARPVVRAATMSRNDNDKGHGVKKHVGLFQERYNGTYMQARGH